MATTLDKSIQSFLNLVNEGLDSPLEGEFVDLLTKCAQDTFGPIFNKTNTGTSTPTGAPKKKRGKSGYNIYMSEYKNEHPNTTNLFKVASAAWGALTDAEKEPFNTRAKEENQKSAENGESAQIKPKNNGKKKALNGYHLYVRAEKKKDKDASMKDIGARWKGLGDDGQAPFKKQASDLSKETVETD